MAFQITPALPPSSPPTPDIIGFKKTETKWDKDVLGTYNEVSEVYSDPECFARFKEKENDAWKTNR